ncbi:RNAase [candidate division KSB1 bacterium]|nr:RNAase [candidate division KSB1 bacterium]
MTDILKKNLYLVKEHIGMFKAANNYDIYDPQTGQIIMECREENLGFFTKMLRFTDYKRMTPFDIEIRTPNKQKIVRIKRGTTWFRSHVDVFDEYDKKIGGFRQKLLSIGGAFEVLNQNEEPVCSLKGKWTGWNFSFKAGETEIAHVSKKWAGIGKEFFTSADNYILEIKEHVAPDDPVRRLILAAVMCIDMVLKE